jgi:hypothetical protein
MVPHWSFKRPRHNHSSHWMVNVSECWTEDSVFGWINMIASFSKDDRTRIEITFVTIRTVSPEWNHDPHWCACSLTQIICLTKRCSEQRNWLLLGDMNMFNCSHLQVIGSLTDFNWQDKRIFICLVCMQANGLSKLPERFDNWESSHICAVILHSWTWTRSFNTSLPSVNLYYLFIQFSRNFGYLNSVSWSCEMSSSWLYSLWLSLKPRRNASMI